MKTITPQESHIVPETQLEPAPAFPALPRSIISRARDLAFCFTLLFGSLTGSAAATVSFPVLWQKDLQSLLESSPTVADLRGDGRDEIVIAGREELFALDAHGKALWRWRTKARFMTYPAVLTRPGQPALIYAADNGGLLTCLDGTGQEVWHAQLNGPSSWSASVLCDLDGNGQTAVIPELLT